jgi:ABC-2 type transport system permease protein
MRIVRKIMLKGSDLADITHDMRALGITLAVITALAMLRYRQTLE